MRRAGVDPGSTAAVMWSWAPDAPPTRARAGCAHAAPITMLLGSTAMVGHRTGDSMTGADEDVQRLSTADDMRVLWPPATWRSRFQRLPSPQNVQRLSMSFVPSRTTPLCPQCSSYVWGVSQGRARAHTLTPSRGMMLATRPQGRRACADLHDPHHMRPSRGGATMSQPAKPRHDHRRCGRAWDPHRLPSRLAV